MSLQTIKQFQKQSALVLPPLRFYSLLIVLILILLFKYFIYRVKANIIGADTVVNENKSQSLEMKYYYHLALVLVILPDISWNLFDFAVWVFSYIFIGIIRNLFLDIELQKTQMLNGLLLDKKFQAILLSSEKLSGIAGFVSLVYFLFANWYFLNTSIKMNYILMYPTILLLLDSIYMMWSCRMIKNSIINFFDNNIDCQTPRFRLQSLYKTIKYLLSIFHFSEILKIIYKTNQNFSQLSSSIYAISVIKEIYESFKKLFQCLLAYQRFVDSLNQMNKYLPEAKADADSECPICQQELYACRQIKQCGHRFHFKCIFDWIKSKQIPVCPVCRGVIIRSRYIRNREE